MEMDVLPKVEKPIDMLSEELIMEIFKWMGEDSLRACACVDWRWHRLAHDDTLWKNLCKEAWAWRQKYHMVDFVMEEGKYKTWKEAYYGVRKDAKRTSITLQELCSTKWRFYFRSGYWMGVSYPEFTEDYRLKMGDRVMTWKFVPEKGIQVPTWMAIY